MKSLCVFFVLFSSLMKAQSWLPIPDFPGSKRDDGVAVVVNNKVYVGTGLQEWSATIDFYAFDFQTAAWTAITDMPHGSERQYACAFSGNNCFYVFGGENNGNALNDLYKYDVLSGTWQHMSAKPGNGLVGASCMNFGNKIIICGGKFASGKPSHEVWEYTLSTDSWLQKNPCPFAGRWRASSSVLNTKGYLIFGLDSANVYHKELYVYDESADQWLKVMDFPHGPGRAYASLNTCQAKLVLFGGKDSSNMYYKDLWYYEPLSNTWIQGPDLPATGRRGGMSCSYGESVFYTCGLTSAEQRLTESWIGHVPLSVKEQRTDVNIRVFPTLSEDEVFVELSGMSGEVRFLTYSFRSIDGAEASIIQALTSDGRISLAQLSCGTYVLTLYLENKPIGYAKVVKL